LLTTGFLANADNDRQARRRRHRAPDQTIFGIFRARKAFVLLRKPAQRIVQRIGDGAVPAHDIADVVGVLGMGDSYA